MKKNTVMRVLSLLLVLTLMSTCAISGTFAKYVTKAEGEDTARVAKWGVLVSMSGSTFADKYAAQDETYLKAGGEYSVEALNGDKVVAPGTSSDQLDSTLVATVSGKPEVAARYTLEGSGITDIVLPAGTYIDYTHLGSDGTYSDTFTLDEPYAPIKWDITISKGSTTYKMTQLLYDKLPDNYLTIAQGYGLSREGCSIFDAVQIIEKVAGKDVYKQVVEAALAEVVSGGRNFQLEAENGTFKMSYDFDPNKDMGFTFKLTWQWAFEQGDTAELVALYDAADTYLGNIAAGVEGIVVPDGASTVISAHFVATATQID